MESATGLKIQHRGMPGVRAVRWPAPGIIMPYSLKILFAPDLGPNPMMNDVYMYTYLSISVRPTFLSFSAFFIFVGLPSFAVTEAINQSNGFSFCLFIHGVGAN